MIRVFGYSLLTVLIAYSAPAEVLEADYTELMKELDGRIDFETLPPRHEPGIVLDAPLRSTGAWLGAQFAGQTVDGPLHDVLSGEPDTPLRVASERSGRNLSIAMHRGFGSNALFPLGLAGFPALEARGEGAVAMVFDRDQSSIGFRVHSNYTDPLGQSPAPGQISIQFFNRSGDTITSLDLDLTTGITEFGFRRVGNVPDIAGVTITNTDPGGIAIDDVLFQLTVRIG